mmetsp:Transcript_47052/g.131174  ORF Transcript_47052/g.131174 Transcript_47052/m.131174 type:complete len:340 (+) Transcript_47052:283-1302(+)
MREQPPSESGRGLFPNFPRHLRCDLSHVSNRIDAVQSSEAQCRLLIGGGVVNTPVGRRNERRGPRRAVAEPEAVRRHEVCRRRQAEPGAQAGDRTLHAHIARARICGRHVVSPLPHDLDAHLAAGSHLHDVLERGLGLAEGLYLGRADSLHRLGDGHVCHRGGLAEPIWNLVQHRLLQSCNFRQASQRRRKGVAKTLELLLCRSVRTPRDDLAVQSQTPHTEHVVVRQDDLVVRAPFDRRLPQTAGCKHPELFVHNRWRLLRLWHVHDVDLLACSHRERVCIRPRDNCFQQRRPKLVVGFLNISPHPAAELAGPHPELRGGSPKRGCSRSRSGVAGRVT